MALTFGALTTDRVNCAAAAGLGTTWTVLMWVFVTTNTAGKQFFLQPTTGAIPHVQFLLNGSGGTAGNARVLFGRATARTDYITSDRPFQTGSVWKCIAATFDTGAGAGLLAHIYHGDLATVLAESTYGTATDGSGAFETENAALVIGNNAVPNSALLGRIAVVMAWNRVLSLAELQSQQFRPRKSDGCVLFMHLGFNGVSTQGDLSGNVNNGTVTGATQSDHVPLFPAFGLDASLPLVAAAAAGRAGSLLQSSLLRGGRLLGR